MLIQPGQLKRLHALLNKAGLMDEKADLVKQYSACRETSSTKLEYREANSLIKHLEDLTLQMGMRSPEDIKRQTADTMRKKIISMLREVGFETTEGSRKKADMKAIYSLIIKIGYLKPKSLNQYDNNELPKLVSQIESYYQKELKRINNGR